MLLCCCVVVSLCCCVVVCCVVVLLCCCIVVLLYCCIVHLTKMCQNGMQEKRESCSLLVVIQKEEHKMEHRNGEKHALFYIYFYYSCEGTVLWHVHLTKT